MKSLFKKFDTSSHFPDFKHTAKGKRDNKKIRAKKERQKLKEEQWRMDTENRCVICGAIIPEGTQVCPNCSRGKTEPNSGHK